MAKISQMKLFWCKQMQEGCGPSWAAHSLADSIQATQPGPLACPAATHFMKLCWQLTMSHVTLVRKERNEKVNPSLRCRKCVETWRYPEVPKDFRKWKNLLKLFVFFLFVFLFLFSYSFPVGWNPRSFALSKWRFSSMDRAWLHRLFRSNWQSGKRIASDASVLY